ncbi:YbaL family putative K(+) efflux transporter [Microbulbifer taiwanensis]|uniref:YbaL family putative K(+) efflux transporter n=1 Tax=Microbulbifer taiwanensis TaxID=986746 RepID=UPI001866A2F4|nr:YbaL family putative K(+) efflux transporter [Microbulbifer taiwanensis]
MHHDITLITTISAALGLALLLGFVAVRLRLPALVGYLVAGVLIGPATPGFVADIELSQQLAEIGVILLMFGVGLHFSMADLMSVRRIAIVGALAQIAVATALGASVAGYWGWSLGASVVFGLSLSVASTVVLLRGLEARGLLDSINGRIAVGWLVVEDIVMVLALVVLPPLAGWLGGNGGDVAEGDLLATVLSTLGKVAIFVALMLVVGRRLFPWFLWKIARTGSRELFSLCVIATAMGIAFSAAEVFGVSFALGAFFAGSVLRESSLSHRAADESLPLRDAFAVLFFVSVGMLFDPRMLVEEPLRVLAVLAIIVLGKTLAAFALVLLFRYPLNTALTVSASLAQIGEFSFILAGLGASLGLLSVEGQNLILAGALFSIAINPLLFNAVEPLQRWIRSRSRLARAMERPADPLAELPETVDARTLTGHALLVGYGRVGSRIGRQLEEYGISLVVAEQNREIVEQLRRSGIPAVSGDAAEPEVLIQAHVARARILVVAIPDVIRARKMVEIARMLKPDIETVVRAHSDEEAALLRKDKVGNVLMGEHELAMSMTRRVLERFWEDEPGERTA